MKNFKKKKGALFEPKEQLFNKKTKETLPVVKFEVHIPIFLSRLSLIHLLECFQPKPTRYLNILENV